MEFYPKDLKIFVGADSVTAQGAGSPFALGRGKKIFTIDQSSTPTATVKVQFSNDPANVVWEDLYTHTTSGSAGTKTFETDLDAAKFRFNVTSYSAGTIKGFAAPVA